MLKLSLILALLAAQYANAACFPGETLDAPACEANYIACTHGELDDCTEFLEYLSDSEANITSDIYTNFDAQTDFNEWR